MPQAYMTLKVLLPHKVFSEEQNVLRIVATTPQGAFGILPNRLDCVASLSAGILVIEVEGEEEAYIAVDEGVLVKAGADVRISVRNAMNGMGLEDLRHALEDEFIQLDEQEQKLRSALTKMESGFVQRLVAFKQDASVS
ncbi:F0F1 ATP synthase subunit epsilon [Marinomonas sp. UCMA 3892]|uniref:F0F1 ATP synthase subunit epsilon n=1 Tax=unclassified Marinomonas TaxID=196814 RepID=UPI00146BC063|nr:F0F1 ATP synthase subunit epsilon [Marinomonas sp. UCMA 3892]NLU99738.1 F0F1 ATP synthase subunit epsilon [Marinomonas sp. UCMA 3892]